MSEVIKIHPGKLGFDFDGVIADIGEAFLRLACEEYNYCSYTLEDIVAFQVENCINIPPAIIENIFNDILEDSLATGLIPMEGVVETLNDFSRIAPVTIITARTDPRPVYDWLDHFFPKTTCDNIHLIAMGDHDDKVRYLQQQNLTYFIDDRAETCALIAKANFIPYLYSHPWNSMYNSFKTVKDWQEIRVLFGDSKELPSTVQPLEI